MRKDNYEWQLFVLMLKEIATEKGITQEIIAQRSGLIQSNVSRIFALKYKPTLDTFLQVAKAVGVNFFFEDKESKTDLNVCFERAMESLGRRPDKLTKN
jgi:transcriptional regulator with XRE-family HTH domain